MSIATGGGDRGDTGLIDGSRVPKDDPRLDTYGTVDELNALVGVARCATPTGVSDDELQLISTMLFDLGSDLATPGAGTQGGAPLRLGNDAVDTITGWIHREEQDLPRLKNFILPGGTAAGAALHHARTVCRRAERHVATLLRTSDEGSVALVFLNRLSDLLFLYARRTHHASGVEDVQWRPRG